MKVKVQRLSQHSIEFDIVGVDTSIANAFRRIMIAEVERRLHFSDMNDNPCLVDPDNMH